MVWLTDGFCVALASCFVRETHTGLPAPALIVSTSQRDTSDSETAYLFPANGHTSRRHDSLKSPRRRQSNSCAQMSRSPQIAPGRCFGDISESSDSCVGRSSKVSGSIGAASRRSHLLRLQKSRLRRSDPRLWRLSARLTLILASTMPSGRCAPHARCCFQGSRPPGTRIRGGEGGSQWPKDH
jgi:hypothetical protein